MPCLPASDPFFDNLLSGNPNSGQIEEEFLLQIGLGFEGTCILLQEQQENGEVGQLALLEEGGLKDQREQLDLLINEGFGAVFECLVGQECADDDYFFLGVLEEGGEGLEGEHVFVDPPEGPRVIPERVERLPHHHLPALPDHLVEGVDELASPLNRAHRRRPSLALLHFSNIAIIPQHAWHCARSGCSQSHSFGYDRVRRTGLRHALKSKQSFSGFSKSKHSFSF